MLQETLASAPIGSTSGMDSAAKQVSLFLPTLSPLKGQVGIVMIMLWSFVNNASAAGTQPAWHCLPNSTFPQNSGTCHDRHKAGETPAAIIAMSALPCICLCWMLQGTLTIQGLFDGTFFMLSNSLVPQSKPQFAFKAFGTQTFSHRIHIIHSVESTRCPFLI